MRYSMESALKLFLFVSLVTFSTVTLGHVHSMGLELKIMWFHRSGPLTKREDGRYSTPDSIRSNVGSRFF